MLNLRCGEYRRPRNIPAPDNADNQKQQGGQEGTGHWPIAELLGKDHGNKASVSFFTTSGFVT